MAEKRGTALGVAGFTLGIVSLVLFSNPFYGILAAIIGLILSIVQQKKNPTRLGRWGIILNIIGIILGILFFYFYIKYLVPYLQNLNSASFPIA